MNFQLATDFFDRASNYPLKKHSHQDKKSSHLVCTVEEVAALGGLGGGGWPPRARATASVVSKPLF
jgi:hypothetical protein